ncbi:MAG: polysaccharide lyase, partial [Nitrososphaera sp.]|nr:polysaccharide lyase [Nitrososphaera sp.]
IQDGQNIDKTNIGQNLVNLSELRAVAGCNGDSDGYGNGACYPVGSEYRNGKLWKAGKIYFSDTAGAYYKGDWHHVEAFFKLNTIVNGKGVADGVLKYWYDGQLIIDRNAAVIRTGQYPSMKFNQFLIAPYIGDGSPVDQTFWIDNLVIGTAPPATALAPPRNLRTL